MAAKRPWLSQLQGQSFTLLSETLAAWGEAFGSKLSAQSCLGRLPEALCAARSLEGNRDAASRCRRARCLASKAWEGLRPLGSLGGAASGLAVNLCTQSGAYPRGRFLPGLEESWTKAGWFEFKEFGPEEESASPHGASPALQTASSAFLVETCPPGPRAWAVSAGSLGASSAGHTLVSFCTSRNAG